MTTALDVAINKISRQPNRLTGDFIMPLHVMRASFTLRHDILRAVTQCFLHFEIIFQRFPRAAVVVWQVLDDAPSLK